MQYRSLEENNAALSTWCSVLFLRHLKCILLCHIFKAAMKKAACQENTRKWNISASCAITRKWPWAGPWNELSVGSTCVVIASHCGHRTYALSAGLALLLFHFYISFSHSSSTFCCLTIMSLDTIFPQFLWFTHFSLYLPFSFFFHTFMSTTQCLWQLCYNWFNFISIIGESFSAVWVEICVVCTGFYHSVFSL